MILHRLSQFLFLRSMDLLLVLVFGFAWILQPYFKWSRVRHSLRRM